MGPGYPCSKQLFTEKDTVNLKCADQGNQPNIYGTIKTAYNNFYIVDVSTQKTTDVNNYLHIVTAGPIPLGSSSIQRAFSKS